MKTWRNVKAAALKQRGNRKNTFAFYMTLSYCGFLLICLTLGVVLYRSSSRNAENSFWQQWAAYLENKTAVMDGHLATLDTFTRQLLTDSTFVRFANMTDEKQQGFYYTAYEVMQSMSSRVFSLLGVPIKNEGHIYLKNVDYIITSYNFTRSEPYYREYRKFERGGYQDWLALQLSMDDKGRNRDISAFTGQAGDFALIYDFDDMLPRRVPAVIWFEWDAAKLRELFLTRDAGGQAMLLIVDEAGRAPLILAADEANQALAPALAELNFGEGGFAQAEELRVIRRAGQKKGWSYVLALPENLSCQALGDFDWLFALIMVLAALGGGGMVALLVRRNMRPIRALDSRLRQAEGDNAQLQQRMDSQRPVVCAAYLRQLLSGHVASSEEFAYILRYLGLEGRLRFFVLYCVAYDQQSAAPGAPAHELLDGALPKYLAGDTPLYYYATDHNYVALCAYDDKTPDPLMDLQKRVLSLHDHLAAHGLWFYAGVGRQCDQPLSLWESYEQARTAARYTARHHIFLPYEMMRKDSDTVYYPIEISAKLLHFITTGNRPQVAELFSLIYQENVVERTLPPNILNFLLSDLKNTLLKARFSALPKTDDHRAALARLDERLSEPPTFPICESAALTLCGFFQETAVPSDPVPDMERHLRENFTDPSMCLSKLSERFHISESYLSHLFKEKTGQNFSVYLENLRLSEASRRLKDKDCNLASLYLELGYNSPATFRRAFKKRFGVPPSEMREG